MSALDLAFPLKIPKTRSVKLGGERMSVERFSVELREQSLADVRNFIQLLTKEVIAEQIALGNPPQIVEVDGAGGKPIEQVDKKTVTLFGTVLGTAAMREIEMALREAIERSTILHSGRLRDIGSTWAWFFVPRGGAARRVGSGTPLESFSIGDRLVLTPSHVPYATLINRNVARSGRANIAARTTKKGRIISAPKRLQNRGFLFHAADALRRRSAFKMFRVAVVFSKINTVPGELMTQTSGTGMIVVTPRAQGRVG